jgi:phage-related protein
MPSPDLNFTFDPSPIINGFKKIAETSMHTFEMMKGGIFRVVGTLQSLAGNFPEIGQAVGIMKDVFMKNLLWPLRQAIMPILQKLMNWVRDNRGMFVRWGMIIKNVFTVATNIFKTFWEVLKGVGSFLFNILNKILGTNTKNLEEMINLLTFKLAVGFELLKKVIGPIGEALKPLLDFITQIAGTAFSAVIKFFNDLFTRGTALNGIFSGIVDMLSRGINFVKEVGGSFFKGFFEKIQGIGEPIRKIVEAFQNIQRMIFGSDEKLKGWKALFEGIGKILSETIVFIFEDIAKTLNAIIDAINRFFDFWDKQKNIEKNESIVQNNMDIAAGKKKVVNGKLVDVEQPALPKILGGTGIPSTENKNNTMNFGDINIIVPPGVPVDKATADGVKTQLRLTLNEEETREGNN